MKILSFNIAHDSSVCLLNNGEIEFFCKEERLSRIKRDKHPFKSLETLKSLNLGKIDYAIYSVPSNNEPDIEFVYSNYIKKTFNVELENFSSLLHHSSHASLAYYNSGFEEALVFVIDRNGSIFFVNNYEVARESESVYIFKKNSKIKEVYKNFWTVSQINIGREEIVYELKKIYGDCEIRLNNFLGIVKVYEAATTLIGQDPLENGKTMGLSAYGELSDKKLFREEVPIAEYFNDEYPVSFFKYKNKSEKLITKENYHFYANMAKLVQSETQNASMNLIKKYVNDTGIKNVCIVGGYGLNVVANNFYIKEIPEVNFYFEPVSDDTGISIGAAMLKYKIETGNDPHSSKNNFYHFYSDEKNILGKKSSVDEVSDILISGKSVAIFEGNPESGPRALGHRTILFDARNPETKEIVNKIKKREWYRPFAGVILEEFFEDFFETYKIKKSPYMTINFDAKEKSKKLVPGIIHVDGTSRVQTVSDGFLYELLNNFYKKTNCPILLNTSFNIAGEPLVQTKNDAINTLKNSSLDYVFFVESCTIFSREDLNE
jgi:carbamoyltransferase